MKSQLKGKNKRKSVITHLAPQRSEVQISLRLSVCLVLLGIIFGSSRDMGMLIVEILILMPLFGLSLFYLCAAWADNKSGYKVKFSTLLLTLFPFITYAEQWRLRMGLDCEVVATTRMWAGFYVFTTFNCGF